MDDPLLRRFPDAARLPRARLLTAPTPVDRVHELPGTPTLWIKRDDLDAPAFAGNKARALEFLLGGIAPGERVLTLGGEGSTHVLATAYHAMRLGARTTAVRWRHEMSPIAHQVAERAEVLCDEIVRTRNIATAALQAYLIRSTAPVRWIPIGGSNPLGTVGHIAGGLELAAQIADGLLPPPTHVVVPLGSGGTTAGILAGLAAAGVPSTVVGVRVGPRFAIGRRRVLRLARRGSALVASGSRGLTIDPSRLQIAHHAYGGAYGRALPAGTEAAALLHGVTGLALDATYSAKAFSVALEIARRGGTRVLFWLTFDGRWLTESATSGAETPRTSSRIA